MGSGKEVEGTVGGGRVEARGQRLALEALADGRARIAELRLEGTAASGEDPVCGGSLRLLVQPVGERERPAHAAAADLLAARRAGLLVSVVCAAAAGGESAREEIDVESECLDRDAVLAREGAAGGGALRRALAGRRARWISARSGSPFLSGAEPRRAPPAADETGSAGRSGPSPGGRAAVRELGALLEPLLPAPRLVVVGGGHVGRAVVEQARLVGFEITVIDDRPEFASAERFGPGVETRCARAEEELPRLALDGDTSVVIVQRGHRLDEAALEACAATPAGYVGMIGSRRKVALLRAELVGSGRIAPEAFDRVRAPIGLPIGAETAAEIALAIVAEVVAERRRGDRIGHGACSLGPRSSRGPGSGSGADR